MVMPLLLLVLLLLDEDDDDARVAGYHSFLAPFLLYSKTCLKRTLCETEFVLNGNIFMSRDFEAQTDVKYPGLNRN